MSNFLVIYVLIGAIWTPTPLTDLNPPVPAFEFENAEICEWAKERIHEVIEPHITRPDGHPVIIRGECVPGNTVIKPFQEA